ncbi:MAG TPA: TatD family hydrolase [Baekduia sp.]|uniref:TatD family hydrolase n=1 Tax=Baekduia sp. TaxID=2600305 RepID=UPI002D765FE7|nr:TatD family hydrolase [Baekduia sp.]HET6505262.1 TatD family hydrolase [Baekduia sp.]
MIDSHTHLDSCGAGGGPSPAELVGAARDAGVTRILTVGQDAATGEAALAATRAFPGTVYAAIGHHPNHATGFGDAELAAIARLAQDPACRAIGETGLDDFRDYAPRADQERAFHAQIDLARELDKPLVIHTRAADDDTIATLRDRAAGLKVILHCFSMPDRLDECLGEGWFISFAGNVTYPKNGDLAAATERVPDDRILVETDAPYLTPQPHRKHRNQPAFVTETARFVADRRGQSYADLEAVVERNAAGLFQW